MISRLPSSLILLLATLELSSSQNGALRSTIVGNITLGGLFTVHYPGRQGPCSQLKSLRTIQNIEAMLFSVDQINADEGLLPNITLGVKAFDTCGDATSALNSAVKEFVLGKKWKFMDSINVNCEEYKRPVIGVIGPGYSYEAVHITPFLSLFEIPLISYSATSTELSDKDKYEYFSRTAASDVFQTSAIIDLLVHFNWTYVSILYSDEAYGKAGYAKLKEKGEERGIYFANKLRQVPQKYDKIIFDKIVDDILSIPKARVIIFFGVESVMEPLLHNIQERAGNTSLQFIASDSLATEMDGELKKIQQITQQAIFFGLPKGEVEGFTEYFLNLSVQQNTRNPWFKEFFAAYMNCTFDNFGDAAASTTAKPNCDANQTLASTNFLANLKELTQSAPLVVDAVYAFAHALDYILEGCQRNTSQPCVALGEVTGHELLQVLRQGSFPSLSKTIVNFSKSGDVWGAYDLFYHGKIGRRQHNYFKVAQWNSYGLQFKNTQWKSEFVSVESTCKTFCSSNQYRMKGNGPQRCWECKECKPGSYAVNETFCQECPKGQKPDVQRQLCVDIIPTYLTADGKVVPLFLVVLPMTCSAIGIIAVLLVFVIFVTHWNTPIVKASGRELSSLLLLGIFLAFLFSFVVISRPSSPKCVWQFILCSLPFTMCFVAIAVKNNRTYRIFNRNRVLTSQPSLIRPKSQILISMGLIIFQLILLSALATFDFPRDELIYTSTTISNVCIKSTRHTVLSHVYNVLLLIACTYYGYKTKNIPRNFNEAKHIALALYGICLSMIAFGVVFFISSRFSNEYGLVVEMLHNNLLGYIIMGCFFGPKVYIIIYKPAENSNSATMKSNSIAATVYEVEVKEHQRPHIQTVQPRQFQD